MTKTTTEEPAQNGSNETSLKKPISKSKTLTGPQRVLDACLKVELSGNNTSIPRVTVLAMLGMKPSMFSVTISVLKKKGWIEYGKDYIRLTDVGRAQVKNNTNASNIVAAPPISKLNTLTGPGRVLDACLKYNIVNNNTTNTNIPRMTVLAMSGMKPSTFSVKISVLKKKGWIEYGKDYIRLTDAGHAQAKDNTNASTVVAVPPISKSNTLSGPQRVLDACLKYNIVNNNNTNTNIPRMTVLAMSGMKPSTFSVTISVLKKKGWIEYGKDYICLTDIGHAQVKNDTNARTIVTVPPPEVIRIQIGNDSSIGSGSIGTNNYDIDKTHEDIKRDKKLMVGQRGMLFDVLRDGRPHDRATTAQAIGCTNKATFAVTLSYMKKIGIIEYNKETIRLSDICFPKGRPE